MKPKIINYLNNYWNTRNVFFGSKIHELKPKSMQDWIQHLEDNNYYFLKDLKEFNWTQDDRRDWIYYLTKSFWKLYISETKAIEFYKNKGIDLNFASRYQDGRYGIDFWFKANDQTIYLIVKHGIYDIDNFHLFKRTPSFNNIQLYDSSNNDEYRFDRGLNKFFLIDRVTQPTTT